MKYFFVVGEASADLHASNVIKSIKCNDNFADFAFMGGDLMAKASGIQPIVHYKEMSFMGISSVLRNIATIRKNVKIIQDEIFKYNPDIVIPVDYGTFSLKYILPFVKTKTNAKIIYYIPPKLWAWKSWRISSIKRYVDMVLCILPFEEDYFSNRGVYAKYIGNPCVDSVLSANAMIPLKINNNDIRQIAILPGSRKQEIISNLEVSVQALISLSRNIKIVVAAAPSISPKFYSDILNKYPFVDIVFDNTYEVLKKSDFAIVTSGTATLETALIGIPQIVIYRMGGSCIYRPLFKLFFKTKFVSLVNIIMGKQVVREFIGSEVTKKNIHKELTNIISNHDIKHKIVSEYDTIRKILGTEFSCMKAAEYIVNYSKFYC